MNVGKVMFVSSKYKGLIKCLELKFNVLIIN